jgi:hypothetical protein
MKVCMMRGDQLKNAVQAPVDFKFVHLARAFDGRSR